MQARHTHFAVQCVLSALACGAYGQTTQQPPVIVDDGEPYGGVSIYNPNTNPDSPYTRRGGSGGRVSPNNSGGACPTGDPCVLTGQYSRYRTSVNAYESTLAGFTGSQASSFGLVDFYKLPNNTLPIISGSTHYTFEPVVAQPLYITDVSVGGTSIDLLLVASLDDWLYAFNTSTGAEAWSAPLNLATADCGSSGAPFDNNIGHNPGGANLVYYGIVATPVIDIYTNTAPVPTAFVVAACVGPSNPSHIQWNLDAINLETGAEIGNVVIQSTGFNPSYQVSRASLLLTHPTTSTTDIYIAFGTGSGEVKAAGACPTGFTSCNYSGWIFQYPVTYVSSTSVTFGTPNSFATSGQTNTTVFPSVYPGLDTCRCPEWAIRSWRCLRPR